MTNRAIEELEKTYLSDASENEFNAWIAKSRKKRNVRWGLSCAASLLIVAFLGRSFKASNNPDTPGEITTVELIQTISMLTENSLDEIICINAIPGKDCIVIKAEFKDGITRTYLMKRGANGSSIEMTAQNK